MISLQNSRSLTDFQRNSRSLIEQLNASRTPLIITVSGKVQGVILDPKSYDEMTKAVAELTLLKAVEAGEKAIREGKSKPAMQVVQELIKEYEV